MVGLHSVCVCYFLLLHLIPSSPLNGHTHKRTHAHALPYFQWKGEPQPRLLKVHLASASPLQLHLPQLEAMNQLVTLSFYSCRITLTASPRKFRGICPLRWAGGHTQARMDNGRSVFWKVAFGVGGGGGGGGQRVSGGSGVQRWSLFLDRDNGRHAHTSRRAAVWRQLS